MRILRLRLRMTNLGHGAAVRRRPPLLVSVAVALAVMAAVALTGGGGLPGGLGLAAVLAIALPAPLLALAGAVEEVFPPQEYGERILTEKEIPKSKTIKTAVASDKNLRRGKRAIPANETADSANAGAT